MVVIMVMMMMILIITVTVKNRSACISHGESGEVGNGTHPFSNEGLQTGRILPCTLEIIRVAFNVVHGSRVVNKSLPACHGEVTPFIVSHEHESSDCEGNKTNMFLLCFSL